MKNYIPFVLLFAVLLSLVGCTNGAQTTNTESETNQSSSTNSESETNQSSRTQREILKIRSFAESMGDESSLIEPEVRQISISYDSLSEIETRKYDGEDQLHVFAKYIEDELGIQLSDKWTVLAHFYDEEKTVGMVKFQYWIGNISTNKCVTFNVDHGTANMVLFTCLDESIDEDSLLARIPLFEARYEQEKLEVKDGQKLIDETISYAYYYNTANLMYTYNVFFQYGEEGVINNEYGTECYIDENGYAVDINASSSAN